MASRFAAVTSEEISHINEEAVPEKNEEGDKIRYGIGIYRYERLNTGMAPTCNWRIKIVSN